eukprot:RCo044836
MDDSTVVQRATEIVLDQEVGRRIMVKQLADQSEYINELCRRLDSAARHGESKKTCRQLYEQVFVEKEELAVENSSLQSKKRALERALEDSEERREQLQAQVAELKNQLMQRDTAISELRGHISTSQITLKQNVEASASDKAVNSDGAERQQLAQKVQQVISDAADHLDQVSLEDDLHDGCRQALGVLVLSLRRLVEEAQPCDNPMELKLGTRSVSQQLMSAERRLAAELKAKHSAHRMLKRNLCDKDDVVRALTTQMWALQQQVGTQTGPRERTESPVDTTQREANSQLQRTQGEVEGLRRELEALSAQLHRSEAAQSTLVAELRQREGMQQQQGLHATQLQDMLQSRLQEFRGELHAQQEEKVSKLLQLQLEQLKADTIPKTDHLLVLKEMEVNFINETKEILAASDQHLTRSLREAAERHERVVEAMRQSATAQAEELNRLRSSFHTLEGAAQLSQWQLSAAQQHITALEMRLAQGQRAEAREAAPDPALAAQLTAMEAQANEARQRCYVLESEQQQLAQTLQAVLQTLAETAASIAQGSPALHGGLVLPREPRVSEGLSLASPIRLELRGSLGQPSPLHSLGELASHVLAEARENKLRAQGFVQAACAMVARSEERRGGK